MSDATKLLEKINSGEEQAASELFPLVYKELRSLAASQLRNEVTSHTLQPTALVHEAYLRLVKRASSEVDSHHSFEDQSHFFAAAAEAMRRILIDHARRKKRLKRGANWKRVPINLNELASESDRMDSPDFILSLNDALEKLGRHDPTAAEVVKLRYFSGLSVEQAALALGISERTANRNWNYARAWLYDRISGNLK